MNIEKINQKSDEKFNITLYFTLRPIFVHLYTSEIKICLDVTIIAHTCLHLDIDDYDFFPL